jgi:Subtilase family
VRVVVVDGSVPAGSLGVDEPIEVPILGLDEGVAAQVRAALAASVPVTISVGASSDGPNEQRGAIAPFSSEGLPFGGEAKPELAAAGVGLATSEPGFTEGGAARYGSISGSSASAALVAGSAALLAQVRPDLDAVGLRGALVAAAQRRAGRAGAPIGNVDPSAASAVELVADPPTVAISPLHPGASRGNGSVTLRNVSRRPLSLRLTAVAAQPGVTATVSRGELSLLPGASKQVTITVDAATLPDAPAAVSGAVRAVGRRGLTLRIGWAAVVPAVDRPAISGVTLSAASFTPSDRDPAVLTLVAGRVDGSDDKPQLQPLDRLELDLIRAGRRLGTLSRLRDLLPGRYAFGITGRGPRGGRLPRGDYVLRVTGTPTGGGPPTVRELPMRIR